MTRISNVSKIAVLPGNGLGDLILTLPALEALKHAYPFAELVLLGQSAHEQLLYGRPSPVDRVVTIGRDWSSRWNAVDDLRAEGFDLAVQLHGGGAQSNPFVNALGARVTIGARDANAPGLDRSIPFESYQPHLLRHLEVVALAGATPHGLTPRVAVTERDRAQLEAVLPAISAAAVLHPGATDPRRRWNEQRYAALARTLARSGVRVLLTGDETERSLTAAIAAESGAVDLAGLLSIGALAALYDRAGLAVGNDTGALHLARAVGARTLTIYWIGNLIAFAPLFRAADASFVSWRLACPICGVEQVQVRCRHDCSFVDTVAYADVERAALEMAAASNASHSARNRCNP